MKENKRSFPRKCLVSAVALACAQQAMAIEFETDGGWKGNWNTTVSVSSGWRTQAPDKSIIGAQDAAIAKGFAAAAGSNKLGEIAARNAGYLGAANADTANLNFDKGDRYTTLLKLFTELSMSKGDMGFLVRAKAWYDQALNDEDRPFGHQSNGYNGATTRTVAGPSAQFPLGQSLTSLGSPRPYSDQGYGELNRYDGIALLDAYVYKSFEIGGKTLQLRLGNQAINWGESVFIQGLNQVSPFDTTALRKPGTEIKEALLPIWAIFGNLGLGNGMSVEGFYQFKHRPTNIESCGAYWGQADFGISQAAGFCPFVQANAGVGGALGGGWAQAVTDNFVDVMLTQGKKPSNNGQWGLAFRLPVEPIDTEFGLYAMNLHSRVPYVGGIVSPGNTPTQAGASPQAVVANTVNAGMIGAPARMLGKWEYPEDIRLYGITAATNLAGWSVAAELSHSPNQPVQINGNEIVTAGLYYSAVAANPAIGPAALASLGTVGSRFLSLGTTVGQLYEFPGYDRFRKTQFQVNGVNTLPKAITNVIGASTGVFIAEAGFQWSNLPNNTMNATAIPDQTRYGRAFIYGRPGACGTVAGQNPQPQGCQNDGFFTDFAWGYRARVSADYPAVFGTGWTVTPSLFFAHDVDGYSMDGQFSKGRKTINLGLNFSLDKKHNLSFGYTTYSDSAKYDVFRDRDNVTAAYSYTF